MPCFADYIFSNEHVNHLITYSFDFGNEELLSYYISFLRFANYSVPSSLTLLTLQFLFFVVCTLILFSKNDCLDSSEPFTISMANTFLFLVVSNSEEQ